MSNNILHFRKIVFLIFLLSSVLLFGTIGFIIIAPESWTFLDAFYFTLITLTTIGYSEVHALSYGERLFTIFVIFFGVGITYYIISATTSIIVEGRLNSFIWKRKMERKISKQKGHYIICGYGRIGEYICEELSMLKMPFVVIEQDPDKLLSLRGKDFDFLEGNATLDSVLLSAGIKEAKALAIVVGSDSDSVFITLSARHLNPSLYILARYEQLGTDQKLFKAGATKVLSPHIVSGSFMVQLLCSPDSSGLFGVSAFEELAGFIFEEIVIDEGSSFRDKPLFNIGSRKEFELIFVSLSDGDGEREFNPNPDTVLKAGDKIIVFGNIRDIDKLKNNL